MIDYYSSKDRDKPCHCICDCTDICTYCKGRKIDSYLLIKSLKENSNLSIIADYEIFDMEVTV